MTLLLAFVLGMLAGLRSMTPVAVVAWAAYLRWPAVRATGLSFMAAPLTAYVFALFAVVELVFDKLPITPSRLQAGPLGARIVLGGLAAATFCAALQLSIVSGAIAGALGGAAGAFAGYHVRRYLTTAMRLPDLPVALLEDAVAIAGAIAIALSV
jgi:uncharacterized membrane protein